ncbi:MAG: hypothetical protein K8F90_20480, partial [Hyphomicrobiales bacterium]|nr:hypothetical protein [Hyphomicrobiales bacterium]
MSHSTSLKPGDHLYLVDGSGYIFRAYHALPQLNRKSDGLPVGAVQGFCNMLWKLLKEMRANEKPTHLAVIFDESSKTFRNDIYPEYKAHRPEAPVDLRPQFGLIRQATRAFNVASVEQANYEADDLIATYARQAVEAGATCRIISSDKDLMQLVREGVTLYDTMKDKELGEAAVFEKFGVKPDKVVDVQALMGDSVDNVPGVPGIGEKSASLIINELGSLDALLADTSSVGKIRLKLEETIKEVVAGINKFAGEPVKLGSGAQIAKVLISKCGLNVDKVDKKGTPTADTALVEELAAKGNKFCQDILRARGVQKLLTSQLEQIVQQKELALISKKLVTLEDKVPVEHKVGSFAVDTPKASDLIGFLKALEFTSITKRVAGALDADMTAIEPRGIEIKFWPPEDGAEAVPDLSSRRKPGPISQSDGTAQDQAVSDGDMGPGFRRDDKNGMVEADEDFEKALLAIPFVHANYETVSTLKDLDRWIAEATELGAVAVDTETDSLDSMQAGLVGVSLSTTPGKACYIPLAHVGEGGGLFGSEKIAGQIPLQEAIAHLKPLLENPGVLKIGQNLKY